MSVFETSTSWTTTGAADTVVMPRRHLAAIAILMCIPLPLLSLAALVVPLPQIVERAAATFISIAAPTLGDDPLIRERAASVRSIDIIYGSSEQTLRTPAALPSARSGPAPSTHGARTRGGPSRAAAETSTTRVDPDGGAPGDPEEKSSPGPGGDQGAADPPAEGPAPTGRTTEPGSGAEPRAASPPDSGGSSGGGSSSGGSGGKPNDPPAGQGTPPSPPGADPGPPETGPGSGAGSPPESPPGGANNDPSTGRGKP